MANRTAGTTANSQRIRPIGSVRMSKHGEHLADAHDDQERDDVRAAPAEFGEHLAVGHAGLDALLHRKSYARPARAP